MIVDEDGELYTPPIWVDFMHIDWENHVRLDLPGTQRDLTRLELELTEGRRIVIYQEDADDAGTIDDLVTAGTGHFDPEESRWVAIVDWDSVRHVSELPQRAADRYKRYRHVN